MPMVTRIGDAHACGAINVNGSPNVYANSIPVTRIGDFHSHGSVMIQGSPNVYANSIPICRFGDLHGGCPTVPPHPPSPEIGGSPTVKANG